MIPYFAIDVHWKNYFSYFYLTIFAKIARMKQIFEQNYLFIDNFCENYKNKADSL